MPPLTIEVRIGQMKINNADHAGAISLGSAVMTNRNVCAKKSQGFGQQFADRAWRIATVQAVRDDEASDKAKTKTNGSR